jgi:hypothetical protein
MLGDHLKGLQSTVLLNGNEISDEKSPLQTVILHHSENFTSKKYVEIADIVQDLLIVEITMKLNK